MSYTLLAVLIKDEAAPTGKSEKKNNEKSGQTGECVRWKTAHREKPRMRHTCANGIHRRKLHFTLL
jgi:hypothetical protein